MTPLAVNSFEVSKGGKGSVNFTCPSHIGNASESAMNSRPYNMYPPRRALTNLHLSD